MYQVMTRLFGNTETTNKPWGTLEENGVGKFSDFTDDALQGIRELGTTHVWYTGIPHHAVVRDYTHNNGIQVIIDLVPNHVARRYESIARPEGIEDFGANDDTRVEYARDNNFYYIPDSCFDVPEWPEDYAPLGGEDHPLADGSFDECPAKWTGNGARSVQPDFGDWYETVKVNFGVRPDGSHDFDELPRDYADKPIEAHYEFWQGRDVPDSWEKFRHIALYWLDKGVNGFRFDMAEMVPVELWSYLNAHIKQADPQAMLIAEVQLTLNVSDGEGRLPVTLPALAAYVFELAEQLPQQAGRRRRKGGVRSANSPGRR